jgi:uncharacterized protein YgbK (DUF1537 family)
MNPARPFPAGPLIAFYGDDFTGSSAAMEATAFAGIETVLFLSPPPPERLARFATYRVIGIAGTARAQSPEWMDRNLPSVFRLLRSLGAPIAHYKVCSTFDSSPQVGSIGRAIEIAAPIFAGAWIPMVVGDPGMGRYQAFGHLFAMANGVGYRLDRHPAMLRHPVTPMDEADLALHLGKQTGKRIGLVDFVAMKRSEAPARLAQALDAGAEIVSLDVLDQETLVEAGRLIWQRGGERVFGVGSQGFEAALVAYWRSVGLLGAEPTLDRPCPAERIACVSGSVSPIAAAQIAASLENGFAGIPLDASRAVDEAEWKREVGRAADRALAALGQGRDPLVYTAAGPDDPAVAALRRAMAARDVSLDIANERIGTGLGHILERILREARVTRAVISGGDTSGRAASVLGIDALTAIAPLAPGSPLCRAHCQGGAFDGLEIALKGGQVGGPDFFCLARQGLPR